jgi:hypothetical protein
VVYIQDGVVSYAEFVPLCFNLLVERFKDQMLSNQALQGTDQLQVGACIRHIDASAGTGGVWHVPHGGTASGLLNCFPSTKSSRQGPPRSRPVPFRGERVCGIVLWTRRTRVRSFLARAWKTQGWPL